MMKSDAVRRSSLWAMALMAALAVVVPGCGGNNGTNGPETITDTRNVGVLESSFLAFTATRNGTVDANVNWNNGGNDIDIYATTGGCPDLGTLFNGGCQVLASEESSTLKPETFTFSVTNGGAYKVFAFNLGPGSETITIRLTAH